MRRSAMPALHPLVIFLFQLSVCLGFQSTSSSEGVYGHCAVPVQKDLRFGVKEDWEMANTICCHNSKYAEPSGYFETGRVRLFARLDPTDKYHTFYDSVCGIPLFVAPQNRTMEEWQAESVAHGWPSFREEEVVKQNIVQLEGGEVRSICGTHLGHNIPDEKGARWCIDLACISGYPQLGSWKEPKVAPRRAVQDEARRTSLLQVPSVAHASTPMWMWMLVPAVGTALLVGILARRTRRK